VTVVRAGPAAGLGRAAEVAHLAVAVERHLCMVFA
jgi:hypothetical protein